MKLEYSDRYIWIKLLEYFTETKQQIAAGYIDQKYYIKVLGGRNYGTN